MSEGAGLADSDAAGRWIGVRRHQALLVIGAILLVGDYLTRSRASNVEAVVGIMLVGLAIPSID